MKTGKKKSKKNKESSVTRDDSVKDNLIITYLKTWKNNKYEWKFEKAKQLRLIGRMFDSDRMPDDIFPIFVEYMQSAKGKVKNTVINKAKLTIEETEKWLTLSEEEQEKAVKPDSKIYKRARTILQSLDE